MCFAVALAMGGSAYAYDNTSLSGAITCSSTVVVNANAVASGQITLVADGAGGWASGSASYQRADGATCNYTLASGKYTVNDDGSGESVTRWSIVGDGLAPQSSPLVQGEIREGAPGSAPQSCAPVVPRRLSEISLVTNAFSSSQGPNRSESGTCGFAQ